MMNAEHIKYEIHSDEFYKQSNQHQQQQKQQQQQQQQEVKIQK